jgi:hypothetical protein
MELLGYRPTGVEIAVFSAAAGVAVATVTLLINMLWEALKHVSGRFSKSGIRRCAACMEPAEPGSYLCTRHAQLAAIVQRRRISTP